MAKNPIRKEDILDKFLVTSMYGMTDGDWPHETIAACKIVCTDEDGNELKVFHPVYRNNKDKHAEQKLKEYLAYIDDLFLNISKKIKIRVYQNYSPCNVCAAMIYDFISEWRSRNPKAEIIITITFANFYNTHVYGRNSEAEKAKANIEGLIVLFTQPWVELQLLGVHVGWERFLGMSQFFNLTEDEKNECLDKAESPRRKDRERQDQKVWDEIFRVEDITSGIQNLSIR